MITTHYTIRAAGIRRALRLAVVADLHNYAPRALFDSLAAERPDIVTLPGDFLDGPGQVENALAFLRATARRFPTLCSVGNHEQKAALPNLAGAVQETGAELLDDRGVFRHGIWFGGLSSGWRTADKQTRTAQTPPPNRAFIDDFATREGYKILLCHHPEYYEPYLQRKNIPLILAGHAHGGQWEIGGQGIYAPGQGLLPRYTAGLYDGRLLVSRGLCNTHRWIPRFGNPRELVIVDLWPG